MRNIFYWSPLQLRMTASLCLLGLGIIWFFLPLGMILILSGIFLFMPDFKINVALSLFFAMLVTMHSEFTVGFFARLTLKTFGFCLMLTLLKETSEGIMFKEVQNT